MEERTFSTLLWLSEERERGRRGENTVGEGGREGGRGMLVE